MINFPFLPVSVCFFDGSFLHSLNLSPCELTNSLAIYRNGSIFALVLNVHWRLPSIILFLFRIPLFWLYYITCSLIFQYAICKKYTINFSAISRNWWCWTQKLLTEQRIRDTIVLLGQKAEFLPQQYFWNKINLLIFLPWNSRIAMV